MDFFSTITEQGGDIKQVLMAPTAPTKLLGKISDTRSVREEELKVLSGDPYRLNLKIQVFRNISILLKTLGNLVRATVLSLTKK